MSNRSVLCLIRTKLKTAKYQGKIPWRTREKPRSPRGKTVNTRSSDIPGEKPWSTRKKPCSTRRKPCSTRRKKHEALEENREVSGKNREVPWGKTVKCQGGLAWSSRWKLPNYQRIFSHWTNNMCIISENLCPPVNAELRQTVRNARWACLTACYLEGPTIIQIQIFLKSLKRQILELSVISSGICSLNWHNLTSLYMNRYMQNGTNTQQNLYCGATARQCLVAHCFTRWLMQKALENCSALCGQLFATCSYE